MNILILVAIFVVELLKYWVLLDGFFNVKIKRKWIGLIGLVVYILLSIIDKNGIDEIHLIMYLIVQFIAIITMDVKILHKLTNILIAFLMISCADEVFLIPTGYIYSQYSGYITKESVILLTSSLASFLLIILVRWLKQKKYNLRKDRNKEFVKRSIPILAFITALFLLFTISGLNYAKQYVQKDGFILLANIVIVISSISIGFLVWCMIYINNANNKIEEMLDTERSLKEMQLNYYKEMLDREESTRKYRHDMNNHLICLNQLAKKGESDAVIDYLSSMQNQMIEIQHKVYKVGNEILDVILNYHLSTLQQNVRIEMSGYCKEDIHINNTDLCTIFANLIQNAVEELKRKSSNEKYLKVDIKSGKEFMKVEIQNSLSNKSLGKTDLLQTEKKDKKNHGLGLRNVKQTIEKNGGKFETKVTDNTFIANVILKNQIGD